MSDLPSKVYLAGKMSWEPRFNYPAFDGAAHDLRSRGIEVVSPAELDSEKDREQALASIDGDPGSVEARWEDFLARDLQIVCDPEVEAVVVLDGWQRSKGATLETDVARRLGKPILAYPALDPIEGRAGEVRITDPDTGGQKGRKPERWDLLPYAALDEVARVYAFGAAKYESHNYLRGYAWSLSLGALQRHVSRWAQGEDRDEETGLHHAAHAAWHCLALLMFDRHGLGTDDRWRPEGG